MLYVTILKYFYTIRNGIVKLTVLRLINELFQLFLNCNVAHVAKNSSQKQNTAIAFAILHFRD